MLPQNHFLVAALVTLVAVVLLYPDLDWAGALAWILVAGVVAAVIDLDVMVYVRMRAREDPELEPWASPAAVMRDFSGFLGMLRRKRILRIIARTHIASAVVATLVGYFLLPSLFIPIAVGAWSHMATDVQYLAGRTSSANAS
jgi:hypothetical protein